MSYRSILIVHPNQKGRELLKEFSSAGTKRIIVNEAETRQDAEAYLSQQNYDVVLTSELLNGMNKLESKGCHVIFIIPNESDKYLDLIRIHKIKYYQVMPKNPDDLKDKINTANRDGVSRQAKRFTIKDTTVFLNYEEKVIQGRVINISDGGFLCEVEVLGDVKSIKQSLFVDLTFRRYLGGSELNQVKCNFLAVRNLRKSGDKVFLILVYLFADLNVYQQEFLGKVIHKADRSQHPFLKWNRNRLEITIKGITNHFYKVHLLRICIVFAAIGILTTFLTRYLLEDDARIIWSNGVVLTKSNPDDNWQLNDLSFFSENNIVKITPTEPTVSKKAKSRIDPFSIHAVLRYDQGDIIFLSNLGTVSRKEISNEHVSIDVTGSVHLIYEPDAGASDRKMTINGVEIWSKQHHLYFLQRKSYAEILVISGNLFLFPKQSTFLSIAPELKPEQGKFTLKKGWKIRFNENKVFIERNKVSNNRYYSKTYLPGFINDGPFRQIGSANLQHGRYQLKRYGKNYLVQVKEIPIMEQDEIYTAVNGKVKLTFFSKDQIRLYPDTQIKIKKFVLADKTSKSTGSGIEEPDVNVFQIKGRTRIHANKLEKNHQLRLQSIHANINIPATDVETMTSKTRTIVKTISGAAILNSINSSNSLTVKEGVDELCRTGEVNF